jgi:intein/homing endonuclease
MRYGYKTIYGWNPSLAYVAGLLASDGCLSNDGRHINITSTDIQLLETAKKLLRLTCSVGKKKNGFGGYGYYIQFSNVSLYDFFYSAGITPAKSKTILRVNLPDEFYKDFLRGLFDGDGTVYGFQDKRWKNSFMYYTEFASASTEFLKWLQNKNMELIGTGMGRIKPNIRASSLSYAKTDSKKIFSAMYHSDDLPMLSRKYTKFVDFLRGDPYADKEILGRVAESVDAPD